MKLHTKSFIFGIIISVCAASVYASGNLRYAVFNGTKIVYNDKLLNLNGKRLVSVARDKERYASNYMPARAVFEALGYDVTWDNNTKAVIVDTKYDNIYDTPENQVRPPEEPEANFSLSFDSELDPAVKNKTARVPLNLVRRENEHYQLIVNVLNNDMSSDTGLLSVMETIYGADDFSDPEIAEICALLHSRLQVYVADGAKNVLERIHEPIRDSSEVYRTAHKKFKDYILLLDEMLKSLEKGDLQSALMFFSHATDVFMEF